MADVAARVGVSRQLVGLVFRDQAGVSAESKERILEAARELGYSPNVAARALRRESTRSIGITFDSSHNTPVEIVDALYSVAHRAGYTLIISLVNTSRDDIAALDELIGYRCEALIMMSPSSDPGRLRAVAGRTPIVIVGRDVRAPRFAVVRARGDDGIESAVDLLVGLGHRDISFVNGTSMLEAELRFSGYRRAMSKWGLPERVIDVQGDYTEESGARAADVLLQPGSVPTAVVCNNDQAALGLIFALRAAGVNVPGRVSVTGYDDNRVARLSFIDLTTVRLDPTEVAEAAIAAAIAMIHDPDAAPIASAISARLVVRGTTAAPADLLA